MKRQNSKHSQCKFCTESLLFSKVKFGSHGIGESVIKWDVDDLYSESCPKDMKVSSELSSPPSTHDLSRSLMVKADSYCVAPSNFKNSVEFCFRYFQQLCSPHITMFSLFPLFLPLVSHTVTASANFCEISNYYSSIPELSDGKPTTRAGWESLINKLHVLLASTHVTVPYTSSNTDVVRFYLFLCL